MLNIAVTVISQAKMTRLLAVFNPRWGAFTFPMTKIRDYEDPETNMGARQEEPLSAATRAAAEVVGRTLVRTELPNPLFLTSKGDLSPARLRWNMYYLHIFALDLSQETTLAGSANVEWLTPAEFDSHEPVSPTARFILDSLVENGVLPAWR